MVYTVLVIIQVVIALTLVGLILVQHGKGADAGAAFGSGASGTVFGAQGAANFLSRATAGLATIFFALSLTLAYLINGASAPTGSVTDQMPEAPGSSLLSDQNENGVAGDEVITGDVPQQGGNTAEQGNSSGNSSADGSDNAGQPAQGSGDGGDDTGARIPE